MFGFGKKVSPADNMVKIFTQKLDAEGLKYKVHEERPMVFLSYKGDNFDSLSFTFVFDEDGKSVAVRVYSIAKFEKHQLADAYQFCNQMNMEYRWIRFYVDKDDEFTAAMDAVISEDSAGAECHELLCRTVSIVDDVYGKLYS